MYKPAQVDVIKQWLGAGSINFFGLPFAGKDSQGRRLAELLDGNLVGGGEILRSSIIPPHVKDHMRAGKLIPSEDYVAIVLPYLSQSQLADKPLILSAVGRWHGEEEGVIQSLEAAGHPLKAVISLTLSQGDVFARWQAHEELKDRGERQEDAKEILTVRFEEFETKTLPVIDYYRRLGLLIEIDATKSRDEVTQSILDSLETLSRVSASR